MIRFMRYLLRISAAGLLLFSVFAAAGLLAGCATEKTPGRSGAAGAQVPEIPGEQPDMLIVYCAYS